MNGCGYTRWRWLNYVYIFPTTTTPYNETHERNVYIINSKIMPQNRTIWQNSSKRRDFVTQISHASVSLFCADWFSVWNITCDWHRYLCFYSKDERKNIPTFDTWRSLMKCSCCKWLLFIPALREKKASFWGVWTWNECEKRVIKPFDKWTKSQLPGIRNSTNPWILSKMPMRPFFLPSISLS